MGYPVAGLDRRLHQGDGTVPLKRLLIGLAFVGFGAILVLIRHKVWWDFGSEVVWSAKPVPSKPLAAGIGLLGVTLVILGVGILLDLLPVD